MQLFKTWSHKAPNLCPIEPDMFRMVLMKVETFRSKMRTLVLSRSSSGWEEPRPHNEDIEWLFNRDWSSAKNVHEEKPEKNRKPPKRVLLVQKPLKQNPPFILGAD